MIKKIIQHHNEMKKLQQLQANIQIEIIETLASICSYLDYDGHFGRNPRSKYMQSHFKNLIELSKELRESEVLK